MASAGGVFNLDRIPIPITPASRTMMEATMLISTTIAGFFDFSIFSNSIRLHLLFFLNCNSERISRSLTSTSFLRFERSIELTPKFQGRRQSSRCMVLQITGSKAAGRVRRLAWHTQAWVFLTEETLRMSKLQGFKFFLNRFLMMPDDLCRHVVAANKDPLTGRSAAPWTFAQ